MPSDSRSRNPFFHRSNLASDDRGSQPNNESSVNLLTDSSLRGPAESSSMQTNKTSCSPRRERSIQSSASLLQDSQAGRSGATATPFINKQSAIRLPVSTGASRPARTTFGTRGLSFATMYQVAEGDPLNWASDQSDSSSPPTTSYISHLRADALDTMERNVGLDDFGADAYELTDSPPNDSSSQQGQDGGRIRQRYSLRFWESSDTHDSIRASAMFSSWHSRSSSPGSNLRKHINQAAAQLTDKREATYYEATATADDRTSVLTIIQYLFGFLCLIVAVVLSFIRSLFSKKLSFKLASVSFVCFMLFYSLFAIPYFFKYRPGYGVLCTMFAYVFLSDS